MADKKATREAYGDTLVELGAAYKNLVVLDADLAEVTTRCNALLGEVTAHGLVDLLGLDLAEAQLHGLVAVGGLRLDLAHRVRLSLDHGHGDELVLLVEDLGHADLLTKNSVNHAN